MAHVGLTLVSIGCTCASSLVIGSDFAQIENSLLPQSVTCARVSLMVFASVRLNFPTSSSDCVRFGSLVSPKSFACMGLTLTVCVFPVIGSSLPSQVAS